MLIHGNCIFCAFCILIVFACKTCPINKPIIPFTIDGDIPFANDEELVKIMQLIDRI